MGDITRRLQPWPVDRAVETLAIGALTASREGLGRKARDRIAHFLRAAIDNDNTKSVGRSLGSFFAFLDDGGRERVQATGPLDVRDNLEATKPVAFSSPTLKQHMAPIRMLFDHLVTGGVLQHNPAPSVKAAAPEARREQELRAWAGGTARPYQRLEDGAPAGIATQVCNDTFRGTDITTYLEIGGTLEKASQLGTCLDPHHAALRPAQGPRHA